MSKKDEGNKKTRRERERKKRWKLQSMRNTGYRSQVFYRFPLRWWLLLFSPATGFWRKTSQRYHRCSDTNFDQSERRRGGHEKGLAIFFWISWNSRGCATLCFTLASTGSRGEVRTLFKSTSGGNESERKWELAAKRARKGFQGVSRHVCQYWKSRGGTWQF